MEQEKVLAISLALIADELGLDPSELRVVRFEEVPTGTLRAYLEETGNTFRQYQLGDDR